MAGCPTHRVLCDEGSLKYDELDFAWRSGLPLRYSREQPSLKYLFLKDLARNSRKICKLTKRSRPQETHSRRCGSEEKVQDLKTAKVFIPQRPSWNFTEKQARNKS